MPNLDVKNIEATILAEINDLAKKFNIQKNFDADSCPGESIKSTVLISAMLRIAHKLGIKIPKSKYIFQDKKSKRKLSISESTVKIITIIKNGQ